MNQDTLDSTLEKEVMPNTLLQSLADGFFICNSEQDMLMHNPSLEKLLERTTKEIRCGKLYHFFGQSRPIPSTLQHNSLDKYLSSLQDWEITLKNGESKSCLVRLNKIRHQDVNYYLGIIHQIEADSDQKIGLDLENSLLEKYLYITNSIIIELDRDANIIAFNHKAEEITGYTREEALGQPWFELVLPSDQIQTFKSNWKEIFDNKKNLEEFFTHSILTKEGLPKIVRWHSIFNLNEKGEAVSVMASGMDITAINEAQSKLNELNQGLEKQVESRTTELSRAVERLLSTNKKLDQEISERKKIQEELRKSKEELTQSLEKEMELNSLKTRFLSMASHEFRTPLATILSSVSLIERYDQQDSPEPNQKKLKHYSRIQRSISHINQMLDDFFSISSLEDGRISCSPSQINVNNFCLKLIDSFQNILKTDQQIAYEAEDSNLEIWSDKKLLKNVLSNLLSNASKYSDEGQTIFLRVRSESSKVYFEVIDHGIGIPESDQKHLFTRFFRANNVANIKGTGIGLSIVKAYLNLLKGDISLHSEIGKGSKFSVSIPKILAE